MLPDLDHIVKSETKRISKTFIATGKSYTITRVDKQGPLFMGEDEIYWTRLKIEAEVQSAFKRQPHGSANTNDFDLLPTLTEVINYVLSEFSPGLFA